MESGSTTVAIRSAWMGNTHLHKKSPVTGQAAHDIPVSMKGKGLH